MMTLVNKQFLVFAVVIDRRESKDCDIGRFELAFKQVSGLIHVQC